MDVGLGHARAVRPADQIDLVVAQGLTLKIEVDGGIDRAVLRQVRLALQRRDAAADAIERPLVDQRRLDRRIVGPWSTADVGRLACAALVDVDDVEVGQRLGQVDGAFDVIGLAFAGSAAETEQGALLRPGLGRWDDEAVQEDVSSLRMGRVLGKLDLEAAAPVVGDGPAAGTGRDLRLGHDLGLEGRGETAEGKQRGRGQPGWCKASVRHGTPPVFRTVAPWPVAVNVVGDAKGDAQLLRRSAENA